MIQCQDLYFVRFFGNVVYMQVMLEVVDVVVVCNFDIVQYLYCVIYYFKCCIGVEVFVYCCIVRGDGVVVCFLCCFIQYVFYGV